MRWYDSSVGKIELTDERWHHIVQFHADLRPYVRQFATALIDPSRISRSTSDRKVVIFYRWLPKAGKYLAIVVKTNQRNFILTAYLTNKIKHVSI